MDKQTQAKLNELYQLDMVGQANPPAQINGAGSAFMMAATTPAMPSEALDLSIEIPDPANPSTGGSGNVGS